MSPTPNTIIEGDCLEVMRQWPDACFDHCIADPPFGISSGGGRKGKKGLGWAFSSHVTMAEEWDQFSQDDFFQFNVALAARGVPGGQAQRQHPRLRHLPQHLPDRLHPPERARPPHQQLHHLVQAQRPAQHHRPHPHREHGADHLGGERDAAAGQELDLQLLGRQGDGRRQADAQPVGDPRTRRRQSEPAASTPRRSRWPWSSGWCWWPPAPTTSSSTPSAAPAPWPSPPRSTAAAGCSSRPSPNTRRSPAAAWPPPS